MFLLNSKVSVLILCLFLPHSEGRDYCRNDLCSPGVTHIGCGDVAKEFGPKCPNDANVLAVDQGVKESVLEAFNSNRKRWASGSRAACKMATMSWDQDLAKLAELNVRQCNVHDDCHNTEKYPLSGQTAFLMWHAVTLQWNQNPTYVLQQTINSWSQAGQGQITFGELQNFTPEVHRKFGLKTLLINENNSKVGCAISTFTHNRTRYYQIVCNYAIHNAYGTPVYTHCSVPGSGCPNGKSSTHSPMCA